MPDVKYTVAVRTLCEFTAKAGDLDLRFTPSATALEGRAGHQTVAARRGGGYQAELALAGAYGRLQVRGRADGYDAARQRLDEVKTFRGDLDRMPANRRALHWAQVKVYGALLCRQQDVPALTLALVYFDVATQTETVLTERCGAAELQAFFEDCCRRFVDWSDQELAHRAARDAALAALCFPHAEFRAGQRPLAEAVYRAATAGRCLMAQAPTGIGKTVGTLYPLLKAAPGERLDKLFFLSAKTPGRALALEALARIAAAAAVPAVPADAPAGTAASTADEPGSTTAAGAAAATGASPPVGPGQPRPSDAVTTASGGVEAAAAVAPTAVSRHGTSAAPPSTVARGAPPDAGAAPVDPSAPLPLRVLELVARDKACEHPDKACHGASCPLANGFYDRLPDARAEAVPPGPALDRERLRGIARAHCVCPYYLAQELVRWCDVIVGDYNHYFDASAMLHGLTLANEWRVGVLVDEAHNLLPRARAMYSADLDSATLAALRPLAPAGVAPALARLQRCWEALIAEQAADFVTFDAPPPAWFAALQAFIVAASDHLATGTDDLPPPLMRFYFDALHFARLCESFGAHSLVDMTLDDAAAAGSAPLASSTSSPRPSPLASAISPERSTRQAGGEPVARRAAGASTLSLRNVVPASFLAPRFAAARTTTLFSATLAPRQFHADLLGLPADAAWIDVPAPFRAEQLEVHIASTISTRFGRRGESLAPIVALIAAQYARVPGNYLAFFSSFDYLQQVSGLFRARHPAVPVWEQSRQMDEAHRAAFLARFDAAGRGIGFAVLGGAFAEGIDLVGGRLVGAFVATLGMPAWNPVNERMKERIEAVFGRGHDYTYLFPGLQRVVQAAGRVIRTPDDTGTLHLIDDRFHRPEVRALLPAWWAMPPRPGERGPKIVSDAAANRARQDAA